MAARSPAGATVTLRRPSDPVERAARLATIAHLLTRAGLSAGSGVSAREKQA